MKPLNRNGEPCVSRSLTLETYLIKIYDFCFAEISFFRKMYKRKLVYIPLCYKVIPFLVD